MRSLKQIIFAAFALLCVAAFARDDVDYFKERDIIKQMINESMQLYISGDAAAARNIAGTAYFQHFENMEGPIGRNVGRKGYLMERKFNRLREMYRTNEPAKRIQALIDGLFFDLDEVTPIIQNGFKIKAVASDPNYDKVAAESNARANLLRQCIDTQKMFGASDEEAQKSCEEQQNAEKEQLAAEESGAASKIMRGQNDEVADDAAALESLQQANAMHPRLQYLHDQISDKFDEAIALNVAKDYAAAANVITELRSLYINSKLEIAINKGVKHLNLRDRLREFGRQIRAAELDEHAIREQSEAYVDEFYEAMQEIDVEGELFANILTPGYEATIEGIDFAPVLAQMKNEFATLLENYDNVATKVSAQKLQSIYLDIFEGTKFEDAIGAKDVKLKMAIEAKFGIAKSYISNNADKAKLEKIFTEINKLLDDAYELIGDNSPVAMFIAAFSILLREGMEALIVVVAIISYLIQSGNANRVKTVYSAVLWAVILSFIVAFGVRYFIANSGQSREVLEGVTMFIAVAFLLYVGFWMLANSRGKEHMGAIMQQTKSAISSGSMKTLWWTVFLAVFREGAETILFYQALFIHSESGAMPVLGGLALGMVVLLIIYFALKAGAIKIPFKAFFKITSIIIFYMAFAFVGQGVVELTAGGVLTPSIIHNSAGDPIFEPIAWLGLHPYYDSLIPQAIILLILISGVLYMQKNPKEKK